MIENINEKNLRSVTTSDTVSDEHSVVKINTELMQRYCVKQLPINKIQTIGNDTPTMGMAIGSLADAIFICSMMLSYNIRNPGNGNRCYKNKTKK